MKCELHNWDMGMGHLWLSEWGIYGLNGWDTYSLVPRLSVGGERESLVSTAGAVEQVLLGGPGEHAKLTPLGGSGGMLPQENFEFSCNLEPSGGI